MHAWQVHCGEPREPPHACPCVAPGGGRAQTPTAIGGGAEEAVARGCHGTPETFAALPTPGLLCICPDVPHRGVLWLAPMQVQEFIGEQAGRLARREERLVAKRAAQSELLLRNSTAAGDKDAGVPCSVRGSLRLETSSSSMLPLRLLHPRLSFWPFVRVHVHGAFAWHPVQVRWPTLCTALVSILPTCSVRPSNLRSLSDQRAFLGPRCGENRHQGQRREQSRPQLAQQHRRRSPRPRGLPVAVSAHHPSSALHRPRAPPTRREASHRLLLGMTH